MILSRGAEGGQRTHRSGKGGGEGGLAIPGVGCFSCVSVAAQASVRCVVLCNTKSLPRPYTSVQQPSSCPPHNTMALSSITPSSSARWRMETWRWRQKRGGGYPSTQHKNKQTNIHTLASMDERTFPSDSQSDGLSVCWWQEGGFGRGGRYRGMCGGARKDREVLGCVHLIGQHAHTHSINAI